MWFWRKKILWQWLERNFCHWRNEDFWRALSERVDFLHYVPFLVMWFTSYLQICICHCGACLKGDTLVQHPAFPGLHVRCQGLLNGYFLDGGFPVLCAWLVCTDKVITTAAARKNKTAAKQEGWKSTFYSWSFLLVWWLIHLLLAAFGRKVSAGTSHLKSFSYQSAPLNCPNAGAKVNAVKKEPKKTKRPKIIPFWAAFVQVNPSTFHFFIILSLCVIHYSSEMKLVVCLLRTILCWGRSTELKRWCCVLNFALRTVQNMFHSPETQAQNLPGVTETAGSQLHRWERNEHCRTVKLKEGAFILKYHLSLRL